MKYNALAKNVNKVLTNFGLKVKIERRGQSVGAASAVFIEKRKSLDDLSPYSTSAQTSKTSRRVLISGLAKEIAVNDVIVSDKTSYLVLSVQSIRPSNVTLIYECEVQE